MRIRAAEPADLDALTTLTIESFRPLFEDHWPRSLGPVVFEHDHGETISKMADLGAIEIELGGCGRNSRESRRKKQGVSPSH